MDEFRLRTRRGGPELKDLTKTLQSQRILDGGVAYVEAGVPTAPAQMKITFSSFEYPFEKTITPGKMKPQIVEAVNKFCRMFFFVFFR